MARRSAVATTPHARRTAPPTATPSGGVSRTPSRRTRTPSTRPRGSVQLVGSENPILATLKQPTLKAPRRGTTESALITYVRSDRDRAFKNAEYLYANTNGWSDPIRKTVLESLGNLMLRLNLMAALYSTPVVIGHVRVIQREVAQIAESVGTMSRDQLDVTYNNVFQALRNLDLNEPKTLQSIPMQVNAAPLPRPVSALI